MDSARQGRSEIIWEKVLVYWVPVTGCAAAIFFLSSLTNPQEQLPSFLRELSDKLLHLAEYAILSALWYRAFRWAAGPRIAVAAVFLAIVAGSIYGVTDEVHQAFVPMREASVLDWVADTVGSVIGALGMRWIGHRYHGYSSERPIGQATPVS